MRGRGAAWGCEAGCRGSHLGVQEGGRGNSLGGKGGKRRCAGKGCGTEGEQPEGQRGAGGTQGVFSGVMGILGYRAVVAKTQRTNDYDVCTSLQI